MPSSSTTTPSNSTNQRIQALSSQLATSPNPSATASDMATEKKPPITCHVLDTTIGKPAANIPVTLTLHNPTGASTGSGSASVKFNGMTNGDGRVTTWRPSSSTPFTTSEPLESMFRQEGDQKYSLTFNTEDYFGQRRVKTFFPEVEVKFVVRQDDGGKEQHYHVPVLLGPFGYTTYRGS